MWKIKTNWVIQEDLPFQGLRLEWFLLCVVIERPLYSYDEANCIRSTLSLSYKVRLVGLFLSLLNGMYMDGIAP